MSSRSTPFALLLALGLTLAPACGPEPAREPAREVMLELEGLDCAGCAGKVREALAKVPGVHAVEVDHASLRARVTCAESTRPESLVQAVTGAGAYQARPIAR